MSLKFLWHHLEPHPEPEKDLSPNEDPLETIGDLTGLSLYVRDHLVWNGDVYRARTAWSRACALYVAEQWSPTPDHPPIPDAVLKFLETGDEGLRYDARRAIMAYMAEMGLQESRSPSSGEVVRVIRHAATMAANIAILQNNEHKPLAYGQALIVTGFIGKREEFKLWASYRLRHAVLAEVLPPELHDLITTDPANEHVLCDAVIEAGSAPTLAQGNP